MTKAEILEKEIRFTFPWSIITPNSIVSLFAIFNHVRQLQLITFKNISKYVLAAAT